MDISPTSTGSPALRKVRVWSLILGALAALAFALASPAAPARADDVDGGSGTGVGGGDGCVKSGWRLVDNVDQIVWEDNGYLRECGNTAYGDQDRDENVEREWNDNGTYPPTYHRCNSKNPSRNVACTGIWNSHDTTLYTELQQAGAGGCYRRNDIHGIWYIQDSGLEPGSRRSWTNLGLTVSPPRSKADLRRAIDGQGLVDSGARGNDAWWDNEARRWIGSAIYDEGVNAGGNTQRAAFREGARNYVKANIETVAGDAPVIYCWFNNATTTGITCGSLYSDAMWDAYAHPPGITRNSPFDGNCFVSCPSVQGQYPNSLPHAGALIPASVGNNANNQANYCYPPISSSWHQGSYGSGIPGYGWILEGTTGGSSVNNANLALPYAYITSLQDGNDAYNPATKLGNAPGQGQFTGRSVAKKSSFGEFWDTYCASGGAGNYRCDTEYLGDPGNAQYNAFMAAYNAAVAATPGDTHAVTDLTDDEKAAVAKGRILNTVEYTTYATAEGRRYRDRFYTRIATRTLYYTITGGLRDDNLTYTNWAYDTAAHPGWNNETVPANMRNIYRPNFATAKPDILSISTNLAVYGATPKVSGMWQNAVAHCNNQEFAPLNPSGNASGPNETGVIDTGDNSQYYSASAVHKVSDSRWRVNETVNLNQARWGKVANGGNNAAARPAFFDRLCYYPGAIRNPDTMGAKNAAAPKEYTFFRDNEQYLMQGKVAGDSPFFVPDFKGEDRQSTVTVVTGYNAKRSTRTTPEAYTVTWQERYVSGSTPYNPGTPDRYAGTYREYWTCGPGVNGASLPCKGASNASCSHNGFLITQANWGPALSVPGDYYTGNGCKIVRHTVTARYPGTDPSGNEPIYAYRDKSASYSTQTDANAGKAWCDANVASGATRGCSMAKTEAVWSTPTQIAVPSCPQTDTATVRYTDCVAVTRDDTITTNYNVVDYRNENPTQMIVTRDQLGTPNANLVKMQGVNNTGEKTELFTTDPADVRTPKSENMYQSQFAANPTFTSSTVSIASGNWRKLQAQGAFASERALPHVVTMAWYFNPNVESTFAQTNLGFGRSGGLMTYTKGEATSPVRGRVEATHSSLTTEDGSTLADHQNQVWGNSGTNIVDGLNVPLVDGADRETAAPYRWAGDPNVHSAHYYVIRFVRAIGE